MFVCSFVRLFVCQAVKTELEGSLEGRLEKLEEQVKGSLHHQISSIQTRMEKKLQSGGGGWQWPFAFIILLLLGGAVGLFLFYQRLKKIHML